MQKRETTSGNYRKENEGFLRFCSSLPVHRPEKTRQERKVASPDSRETPTDRSPKTGFILSQYGEGRREKVPQVGD
jgi:hypothetical protein